MTFPCKFCPQETKEKGEPHQAHVENLKKGLDVDQNETLFRFLEGQSI
jgi:hypothetical protein